MSQPATPRVPTAKSLPQQKTDFTAEGAPLPGHVGAAEPVTAPAKPAGAPRASAQGRGRAKTTPPSGRGR